MQAYVILKEPPAWVPTPLRGARVTAPPPRTPLVQSSLKSHSLRVDIIFVGIFFSKSEFFKKWVQAKIFFFLGGGVGGGDLNTKLYIIWHNDLKRI